MWHKVRFIVVFTTALFGLFACTPSDDPAPEPVVSSAEAVPDSLLIPFCIHQQCAILDQEGKLLMPLSSVFTGAYPLFLPNTVLVTKGEFWELFDPKIGRSILSNIEDVKPLLPDWYAFKINGQYHLYFIHQNKLTPYLSNLPVVAMDSFAEQKLIVLEHEDHQYSVIDHLGNPLGRENYDRVVIARGNAPYILAIKDQKNLLIHRQQPIIQEVPYSEIVAFHDGYSTVMYPDFRWGLIDAEGKELFTPQQNALIGFPASQRIAFMIPETGLCGYYDFAQKVAIPAQYKICSAYGQAGAVVQPEHSELFGLISRDGEWVIDPIWDNALDANTLLNHSEEHAFIPGLVAVMSVQETSEGKEPSYGLVNTHDNSIIFAPQYPELHLIAGKEPLQRWFMVNRNSPEPSGDNSFLFNWSKELVLSGVDIQNIDVFPAQEPGSSLVLSHTKNNDQVFLIEPSTEETDTNEVESQQLIPSLYPYQKIALMPSFNRIVVYEYLPAVSQKPEESEATALEETPEDLWNNEQYKSGWLRTSLFTMDGMPIFTDDVDTTALKGDAVDVICQKRQLTDSKGTVIWKYTLHLYTGCSL